MKTKLSFIVTSAFLLLLSACGMTAVSGSGNIVEEARNVHGYSQVVFAAPGKLAIEQNGQEGLVIEGDDNLLDYIQTRVQGNVLFIEIKPDLIQLHPSRSIHYSLDVDELTNVTLSGSGDIRADELIASNLDFDLNSSGRILIDDIKSQATRLELNGSGVYQLGNLATGQLTASLNGSGYMLIQEIIAKTATVRINGSATFNGTDLIANTLNVTINGSGDSTLAGKVIEQTIAIHGSGSYRARELQSQMTDVKVTGSGDSFVWATDDLRLTIAGSGDISYHGRPSITTRITGSGDLINLTMQ